MDLAAIEQALRVALNDAQRFLEPGGLDITLAGIWCLKKENAAKALQRLAEGKLGECETCEDPIPFARLEATGFTASNCVACASKKEDRMKGGG